MIENVDQKLSKQRQYESKIMQFMAKDEGSLVDSIEPKMMRKNTLQDKLKSKEKQKNQDKDNDKQKHRNVTHNTNSNEQQTIKTQTSIKNNKTKQSFSRKALRSKQPSTLRRKTTLLTSHHNLSLLDNNPQHQPPNHQQLLQKIETKISLINQKITQQITKQQNQLLNEYETKLREKQQLLNRLKRTTNPQMIKQKTMERKQQLKREKESLIEGNMYYHEKMESVKGQLDWLLGSREAGRHTLRMLVSGKGTGTGENERMNMNVNVGSQNDSERISNQKQAYLKNYNNNHNHQLQFVEKVLSTYNQTKIFNQQRQQHNQKSSRSIIAENRSIHNNNNFSKKQYQLNKSSLPRISQQQYNRNISSVVLDKKQSFDNDSNDFYSYRRVKNRFERVRSINLIGANGQGSIIIGDGKLAQKLKFNDNKNKNKQTKSSNTKVRGQRKTWLFGNNNTNNNNQNTSVTVNNNNNNTTNNILYTKQYLQQFVVKKLDNNHNNNNNNKQIEQSNQKNKGKHKNLQQEKNIITIDNKKNKRNKQLVEQLENKIHQLQQQLTIQSLFKKTTLQYYNYKQRLRKGDEKQQRKKVMGSMNNNNDKQAIDDGLEEGQQHVGEMTLLEKIQLLQMGNEINKQRGNDNLKTRHQHQIQRYNNTINKSLTQLQTNQFDKRTVIDLLFSQLQFKQYLYKLMVEQFMASNHQQKGMKRQQYDNVQSIMGRFDQHRLL